MPKIFLNPGHCPGIDPGACNSTTGLRESDVVANIGPLVAKYLTAVGFDVRVVQSNDLVGDVVGAANNWPADLFVSIHCNSAADNSAKGTETWSCNGSIEGTKLANAINEQIVNSLHTVDRGLKIATPHVNGLYVLTFTDMPACLVETAFISNADDEKLLTDADKQDEFAKAIARGVTDYLGEG